MKKLPDDVIKEMQYRMFIVAQSAMPAIARNLDKMDQEEVFELDEVFREVAGIAMRMMEIEQLETAFEKDSL